MTKKLINVFLETESASSIVLFAAAIFSLWWANSSLANVYQQFVATFLLVINDGLMAIFFLSVGLELKRGYCEGRLRQFSQIALPGIGALGGMIVPALIYLVFNYQNPATINGWSTPVATDIAFALGALALLGKRVPQELKLFLLALAIFDDIGAILIIAFFLSTNIVWIWLLAAALLLFFLYLLNRFAIPKLLPYLALGVLMWFCFFKSGVHPTVAGVLLALTIPHLPHNSPLHKLENFLENGVAYLIMPLFALANTGFPLQEITSNHLTSQIVLGIALGLFIGKQVGVFGFSWGLVRLKLAKLPANTSWLSLYGVAILCGIGFTMSLFLGTLSFEHNSAYLAQVRLGVIIGSLLSGITGIVMLLMVLSKRSSALD